MCQRVRAHGGTPGFMHRSSVRCMLKNGPADEKRRGGKNKNKHQKASDMGMHFSALGEEPMSRSGQKVQVSTGVHLDLLARAGVALRTGRR